MLSAKAILFLLLGVAATTFCFIWVAKLVQQRQWRRPTGFETLIGFITNFFDTLGIGSFATTTSLYRLRKTVADEKIPGTLNVGHSIPTLAQAFIYISVIEVDMETLVLLIGAAVLGAWLGAGVVSRWPRRRIQIGMGIAMLAAAVLITLRLCNYLPSGGDALGLDGTQLAFAIATNVAIGAMMTIGVGAYAPIMIMVSLLGMSPDTAYPIMMGSCAFLMPVAGLRFVRSGAYDARASLGLMVGGIPAVLLAALIVWKLPLDVIRWLVVIVVCYTALSLWRSAWAERQAS